MLQIQEQEHIRSEIRFTRDEERLSLEKRNFEHQKDQDRIKWNWNEKRGILL
jgi:hypothetical protein